MLFICIVYLVFLFVFCSWNFGIHTVYLKFMLTCLRRHDGLCGLGIIMSRLGQSTSVFNLLLRRRYGLEYDTEGTMWEYMFKIWLCDTSAPTMFDTYCRIRCLAPNPVRYMFTCALPRPKSCPIYTIVRSQPWSTGIERTLPGALSILSIDRMSISTRIVGVCIVFILASYVHNTTRFFFLPALRLYPAWAWCKARNWRPRSPLLPSRRHWPRTLCRSIYATASPVDGRQAERFAANILTAHRTGRSTVCNSCCY